MTLPILTQGERRTGFNNLPPDEREVVILLRKRVRGVFGLLALVAATAAAVLVVPMASATAVNNVFCGGNGATFVATANVGFLNAAAAQGGFYVWDSTNNFNTVLPYTGPLDLQWIMVDSPSTIGSLSSAPRQGIAGVFMPVSTGSCVGTTYVPGISHVYVCMKIPLPGEGHFAAVTVGQANTTDAKSSDARFSLVLGNATPANWSASHGATCDNPSVVYGEKDQGYRVAGQFGVDGNSTTPYDMSLMGKVAPPQPFGSGINNLYPYFK